MTGTPEIDVTDLKSVRNAARASGRVVGDDWVAPDGAAEQALQQQREKRGMLTLHRSAIARKIITFNLLALAVLVAGVLFLNTSRGTLVAQRANALVAEAELIADVIETRLRDAPTASLMAGNGPDIQAILSELDLRAGSAVHVYDARLSPLGQANGPALVPDDAGASRVTDLLNGLWERAADAVGSADLNRMSIQDMADSLAPLGMVGTTKVEMALDMDGATVLYAATPILQGGRSVGVVSLTSAAGEIDGLVRQEREQLIKLFMLAVVVSVSLSLILASTIANPLADLAAAAELGREKNARKMAPGRVRIPDMTGRPDEIGRLSGALRGMVAALYDRIEVNEQFAADVAHEIKNPLASLRSAVGTLGNVTRDDHRARLLEVIEHDVQRLDRLVSDIANASRLDSELVKEEEASFDLLNLLGNLNEHMGAQAAEKGVEYISDLPDEAITVTGLEGRLAQVFVNLISNAISFCEDGDAIRVWARKRDNRVLIVVEDTGPGIPETSLSKIFRRFYSHRPEGQFGNNSGLGLAISKQIVEAHGGVIWAENIRPTEADVTSEPLGARFVVGLPL